MAAFTPGDFSIVTTVYNGAPYLDRYLRTTEALVGTTGAQIVIIDDGSTDDSIAIVERRARENQAIKLIKAQRLGRSKALNLGVESADRPLIAIQDVDDVALTDRLQRLATMFNDYCDATLFATSGVIVNEQELRTATGFTRFVSTSSRTPQYRFFNASNIFNRNFLIHSAVAFRRTDWETGGRYDTRLKSCIDLDIYFRLLVNGGGVLDNTPAVIFSYNTNSFFQTRKKSDYRRDLFLVLWKGLFRNRIRFSDMIVGYARAFRYTVFT